jgi:hypothetical protein
VTSGATPGKRLLGLRVARLQDGELPTPRQAAARGVIGIFEFGLIACIAIVCTKGRRRLGDLAAGTAVVDARRHPIASRPLFAGALAYPAAWAVPAIVACVLAARGDLPGSYRDNADAICASATRQAPAYVAARGLTGMQELYAQLDANLSALEVPHAWRGRHDEMMLRLHTLRAQIDAEVGQVMASSAPRQRYAEMVARIQPLIAADNARLAAMGYADCSR